MKKILLSISFSLLSLLLFFCTSTSPQTGSLSGTIHLENQQDHSGIVIGVYELAELDPDIVAINQEYPFIGVIINQHTEFDHRFSTLIKTGETDASGFFEINNIPTGVYNVVAIKDGYGFRYIYNVNINNGTTNLEDFINIGLSRRSVTETDDNPLSKAMLDFELNYPLRDKSKKLKGTQENDSSLLSSSFSLEKADITLYPETIINTDISTPTTFYSFHHYIIEQDITVDDELTIEPGAVVRLNDGVKLTIYGDLSAIGQEDNFIWFTSNDSLFSLFTSPISPILYQYNRVELTGSPNKSVSFCKFDHAGTGLLSKVNGFRISDCIFRNSQCGFKAESVDSTFCRNLLCKVIINEEQGGIYFNQVEDGCIERNIVNDCENGMIIKTNSSPEIKNNYIDNCNTGIDISYSSSSDIHNNEIYECETGVYTHAGSYPDICRNEINTNYGIITYGCSAPNIIQVHYNNLNCIYFAIQIKRRGYACASDISAGNNYFYTINEGEIQELIYDKNDVEGPDQQYYGIVDYQPFLTQEYHYAGIQGE